MAKIVLHDYLAQINRLLEDEQPTEAIAHCRHLLRQFPRHVDTYRILARALLENREFEDAAEMFWRILSADPNDFVAHIGLSDIYREDGKLAEATWHLERAYEMSPYDPDLQEVLRELYAAQDDRLLEELPLTKAALARIYFKGELYQQAADELRSLLGQNGDDRIDLQVLLAETLWRDNQRVDAVDVSLKVLEKLPDSITVNAILAEIWLLTGRTEEAQSYLQHLRLLTQVDQTHLDPDSVVGQAFQADGAPILPQSISVEQWRKTADVDRLDAGSREGTEQPVEDEAVYDWLRDGGDTGELLGTVDEEEADWFTDQLKVSPAEEESLAKTSEWLEQMGVTPELDDEFDFSEDVGDLFEDEAVYSVDDSLDWTDSETAVAVEPVDDLPDWLADTEDQADDETVADVESEFDWFTAALPDEASAPDPINTDDLLSDAAEVDFDWLADSDAVAPTDEPQAQVEAEEQFDDVVAVSQDEIDLPDWLTEPAPEDAPEETADSELLSTGDLLSGVAEADFDWLVEEEASTSTEEPIVEPELTELSVAAEVPDEQEGEDVSDWLAELEDEPLESNRPQVDEVDLEVDSAVGTGDLFASEEPAWSLEDSENVDSLPLESALSEAEITTDELMSGVMDDMPDWLADDSQEEEPTASEGFLDLLGTTSELFGDLDEEVPGWLADEGGSEEEELGPVESGLIRRMNRIMGTGDLFDDDVPELESDDAEAFTFEDPNTVPSGFTGLLIGTSDLTEEEGAEDVEESGEAEPDAAPIQDEPSDESLTGEFAGLMGTAELLADLGTDVPDWLREDAVPEDAPDSPVLHTADLQGENLEEVPRWLFREEEDEQVESLEPEPEDLDSLAAGVIGTAELFESLGEEIPDWISELKDDEKDGEETSAEAVSGLVGTDELLSELTVDLPDWVDDSKSSELEDTLFSTLDEEDVPGDEAELFEVEAVDEVAEDDVPLAPKSSLLDRLSDQVSTFEGPQFVADDEEELPDWLSDSGEEERETVIMMDNEPENNMNDMPDDGDDMDWLDELAAQDDLPDKDKKRADEKEAGLSDWLSELTEPASDSEVALSDDTDEPSLTLTDTDLPDWLKDLGEPTSVLQPEGISGSMANLPDWLQPPPDMDIGLSDQEDVAAIEEPLAELSDADDDSLDWLEEVTDDEDVLDFIDEDISGEEDKSTVWLDALAVADDVEEEADPAVDLSFLDDTSEVDVVAADADLEVTEEVGLSDWLSAADDADDMVLETAVADQDDDLLDLFPDANEEEGGFTDLLEGLSEGDTKDWLASIDDGSDSELDEFVADDLEAVRDMPAETAEFMALFEDSDEAGAATDHQVDDVAEVDLPDWLADQSEDGEMPTLELEALEEEGAEDVLELFADPDTNLFAFDEVAEEQADSLTDGLDVAEEATETVAELDDLGLDEADDAASDWLAALVDEAEAEDAADMGLPDWLAEADEAEAIAFDEEAGDEEAEALDVIAESVDEAMLVEETAVAEELPDWLTAEESGEHEVLEETADELMTDLEVELPDEGVALETDDFLAELDQVAADETDLDDPLAWLEQMAAEQEELVEDLPSILDTSMYDALAAEEEADRVMDMSEAAEETIAEEMEAVRDAEAAIDLEAVGLEETEAAEEEVALVSDLFEEDDEAALSWLDAFEDEADEFADLQTLVEEPGDDLFLDADEVADEDTELALAEMRVSDDEVALDWLDALDESEVSLADETETAVANTDDLLEAVEVPDDLEEAMAWLDNLEAEDEIEEVDTLPSLDEIALLDEESALEAEETDVILEEDEAEIDWLAALAEEQTEEDMVEEIAVEPEVEPEPPDPLQQALNRLEALALQDSALLEMDVAESDEPLEAESLDDVLDWLEAQLAAPVVDDVDVSEAVAEAVETAEDDLDLLTDEAELAVEDETDEEVLAFLDTVVVDEEEADLDADAGWEEALTLPEAEEAEIEVDDAVETAVDQAEEAVLDMSETAVDRVEDVAVDLSETAVDTVEDVAVDLPELKEAAELEDAAYGMPDEMSDDDIMAFMDSILGDEDSFIPEKDVSFTPDDPDAVPSFYTVPEVEEVELEAEDAVETVVEGAEEAVLDGLETAVGRVEDVEIDLPELEEVAELEDVADEMPDEMSDDDIMAFMDSILGDEDSFIPEKDVSFTPDDPDAVPSFYTAPEVEEVELEAEDAVETAVDPVEDEAVDLSELEEVAELEDMADEMSDDDIMAFMDSVLGDEDTFVPEKDVSFNPDDPDAIPSFGVVRAADDVIEEVESGASQALDDSDDAIAWLQDLEEAEDDEAMPITSVEDFDNILPELDEDFAADFIADSVEAEESAADQDSLGFDDDTVADSLPDWLEFDDEERMPGHTDWLRSLPEPDVAGWLEAEEEVMAANIFEEIPVPAEPEQPSSFTSTFDTPAEPELDQELYEDEVEEISTSVFTLNEDVLNLARQALAHGNYDVAMDQYRHLVDEGQGLSALIADLESVSEEYQQPMLRRVLGDAYMRNGQLQRALETYRIALDEL